VPHSAGHVPPRGTQCASVPSSYKARPPGVLAWSPGSAARAAGCCQGISPQLTCLVYRSALSQRRTWHHTRARTLHVSALPECRIAAYACARARTPRPRRGTRGRALSWRLRRAAPLPRALRLIGTRARTTQRRYWGPCSRVRSGRPGQRAPRRRAPLDAMGQRPFGCPPSAAAASAARRPRLARVLGAQGCRYAASAARARGRLALHTPCPAVPGAPRPLRRRQSMPVRARCGRGYRLGANLARRTGGKADRLTAGATPASAAAVYMHMKPAGWQRSRPRARRSKLCVGKGRADAAALQLAAACAREPVLRRASTRSALAACLCAAGGPRNLVT
jgi:hypothetical protein